MPVPRRNSSTGAGASSPLVTPAQHSVGRHCQCWAEAQGTHPPPRGGCSGGVDMARSLWDVPKWCKWNVPNGCM